MPLENLLVMALALGVGGLVKGATGMGLPLVALPILAAFLGVQHAVALMCFPGIITNILQVWRFRSGYEETRYFLPIMTLGAIVGIAVGTWVIVSLPERALSLGLGLLVLAYIGLRLSNPHFTVSRALGRLLAPGFGFGAGLLQGATGVGSPLSVAFIHAMRLPRAAHVFAVSVIFLLATVVQVPALMVAGLMSWQIALEGTLALVPALIAMSAGSRLAGRASQKVFDRLILALLVIIACELLWKGIAP